MQQSVDYGWKQPLCLIENLEGRNMKLNSETVERLSQIEDKFVVVSIVGLYRTGKSYLMNRLAGQLNGFQLGSTVQAMTKGIWIWCVPHPTKSNTCLALLDTEGLGDVEKGDTKNDIMLFTLVALLSSTLVYNSKGTIDQHALESLHFVTELAEQVKVSRDGDDDEDDTKLIEYLPSFVWAVRDFILELKMDGKDITSNEYLESALALKKGAGRKTTEFNLPRRCIRRYFQNRRCFVFPLPVADPRNMSRLGEMKESQLSPQFVATTNAFCSHVFDTSPVKAVKGIEFIGRNFAFLAGQYVEDLVAGRVPCIQSVVMATAERVNDDTLNACARLYTDKMAAATARKLPTESVDDLMNIHRSCEKEANELLSRRAMVVDAEGALGPRLAELIGKELQKFSELNEHESQRKSLAVLEELHRNVANRLSTNFYYKIGGYNDYQQDVGEMVRKYLTSPGKGVKAMDVLDDFMSRQSTISRGVMAVDKNLSEQQKAAEEIRQQQEQLKREQQRMQRAVALAEQKVKDESRRREEFAKSLEAKFEQERQQYKRQLSQLQPLLAREQERLKREAAHDDAEDIEAALRELIVRGNRPAQQQRRVFLF